MHVLVKPSLCVQVQLNPKDHFETRVSRRPHQALATNHLRHNPQQVRAYFRPSKQISMHVYISA